MAIMRLALAFHHYRDGKMSDSPSVAPELSASRQENWWNLPNALTVARLVLACFLFGLLEWGREHWAIAATVLFLVATLTDALDGYIARKYQLITQLGRILDPFADKFIVLGTFVYLVELRPVSGVTATMVSLILGRELFVTALRGFLEERGCDFSAGWSGKVKMILQTAALAVAILSLEKSLRNPSFLRLRDGLLWCTVIVTLYSGMDYIVRAVKLVALSASATARAVIPGEKQ